MTGDCLALGSQVGEQGVPDATWTAGEWLKAEKQTKQLMEAD
jgi:hypothetical protein